MEHILAQYDEERIREFAEEGEESFRESQPIYCAECGDEIVSVRGDICTVCLPELIDQQAMLVLVTAAATVEVKCALNAIERAIKHIAKGRYHLPRVASRVIDVLTEAA